MGKIYLNINGCEADGFDGQTILEVAAQNGIFIPTLCHDERVKMYGSCGICVVEAAGMPRLLRACSTFAVNGMIISTDTAKVRETRKTALELLLSDHTGDCRPPCSLACPAGTDCQGYVGLIANGEYDEAFRLIYDKIPLPGSIGRVCPHPCEEACRRRLVEEPISIAALKTFAAEAVSSSLVASLPAQDTGKRVAVIGGGPGGLSASYFLRLKGHAVTVFDAMPHMGGMLRYGIPEYRLPKAVLQKEIDAIEHIGVELRCNTKIGRDITLAYLRSSYDAVIIAVGAWSSIKLRCPGEELQGVLGGIDFLRMAALNQPLFTGKSVAVVGGGNTAMDACRTLVRLGAENVYNIYRRTKDEMPAQREEIDEALEEGVIFKNLRNPLEIIGENGRVNAMTLQVMELGEPDSSGRRTPVPVKGVTESIAIDTVIIAIGQGLDCCGFEDIAQTNRKTIAADIFFQTNLQGVFAIGDAINKGADIAISAIGHAKKAAETVDMYLNNKQPVDVQSYLSKTEPVAESFAQEEKKPRCESPLRPAKLRRSDFLELRRCFTPEEATKEALRCLECGCQDYFECKLIDLANRYKVCPERFDGETHNRTAELDHPFIRRNPDKCILCGLCARACEEVVGETVLGLVGRGFDTVLKPAGDTLIGAGCISCGLCVDVCPTGALTEITATAKQVPLSEMVTNTTCSFCGMGCQQKVTSKGNSLLRSLPYAVKEDALLCAKGRFGFHALPKEGRLTQPMIRVDGELKPVSYEEAIVYTNKKIQALQTQYGDDTIAVTVSDSYTNEEIFLIKEYTNKALHTENLFSFAKVYSGIGQVLGKDRSTVGFDELRRTECILLVESDLSHYYTNAGASVRKAVENGAKLIIMNSFDSPIDSLATIKLNPGNDLSLLKQMVKVAADRTKNKDIASFDELAASLAHVSIDLEAKAAADIILNAKNAVILFEQNRVSLDTAKLIADLSLLAGLIGKPRSGIIQLQTGANAQGLVETGVGNRGVLRGLLKTGALKGMFIFGEDVPDDFPLNLEFLAVHESRLTKTAQSADVIFPAQITGEIDGSFTGLTGERLIVRAVVPSTLNDQNFLLKLSRQAGYSPMGIPDMWKFSQQQLDGAAIQLLPPLGNNFQRCYEVKSANAFDTQFEKLLPIQRLNGSVRRIH